MLTAGKQPGMSFYVTGSADEDSLVVSAERLSGRLELHLPVAAMPWRDLALIEKSGRRRPDTYGCCDEDDILKTLEVSAEGQGVEDRTGIRGADGVKVSRGAATVSFSAKTPLFIPCLRVAEGARMPVAVRAVKTRAERDGGEIRVMQLSGGRRVGGVTLAIREKR